MGDFRLWLVGCVLILTACGGGGGEGGGGAPPQTGLAAGFAATVANPPSNSLRLAQQAVLGDVVTLTVAATALATPSSGAAFDVDFDPALVRFIGFAPGTFYERTGTVTYQAALQGGSDHPLVIGITQHAGPGTAGSGTVIALQFKVLGIGSSAVTVTNNNLIDPAGALLPGITWSAGTLTGS